MGEFPDTARYRIVRRIGSGGMGLVYEAHDRDLDTRVALKTLRNVAGSSLYRFKQEFRSLQNLRHRNLVRLGELVADSGSWFFTMELVDGRDLVSYARSNPASAADNAGIDEARVRASFAQLATALDTLHRAGKVHRDVKPSNVLVDAEGRVVLLDFGLIADYDVDDRYTGEQIVGTVVYMAPEQTMSSKVGPPADWYALGVMLYEALTGELPFSGSALQVIVKKCKTSPPPLPGVEAGVPPDLAELCMRLLAVDPDQRPGAREVLEVMGAPPDAVGPVELGEGRAPFVGREAQMGLMLDAFSRARAGSAVCVFVSGDSGIGKTELLRRFRNAPQLDAAVVMGGRCYERESVPYKALDGIVDALARYLSGLSDPQVVELLPRDAALLARAFPVLDQVPAIADARLGSRLDGDVHNLRDRVAAALRELLVRIGDRVPLVVVIDDYQWSDVESERVLDALLAVEPSPTLLLVVASRQAEPPAFLVKPLRIELEALEPEVARTLARRLLERVGAEPRDASAIACDARGHPLYIDELVRYADMAPSSDRVVQLDDVIAARAQGLEAEARAVLELVALAGEPVPHAAVREAAELTRASYEEHLAMLTASRFIRGAGGDDSVEIYHDRIREAVLERIDERRKRGFHADLARALEASGLDQRRPQLVLRHLRASGQSERAAALAVVAADQAVAALAYDLAASFYEQALELQPDCSVAERCELVTKRADALANTGRTTEAAQLYRDAAADASGAEWQRLTKLAVEHFLKTGHLDEGTKLLTELVGEIGERFPRSSRSALVRFLGVRARLRLRGYRWREQRESDIDGETLRRIDLCGSVALALSVVDMPRSLYFQARWLLLALSAGEKSRIAEALLIEAAFLAVAGNEKNERRWSRLLDRALSLADETGDPFLVALGEGIHGIVQFYCGQFEASSRLLSAAEQRLLSYPRGRTWELGIFRVFRLLVFRWTGSFNELRAASEEYLRQAREREDRYVETTVLGLAYPWRLVADRGDHARLDLAEVAWAPPGDEYHVQHWYELSSRAEVALYEGTVSLQADEIADGFARLDASSLTRYVVMIRTESCWLRARVALAQPDVAGDPSIDRAVERAARALAAEGLGYATALATLLRATVCARQGRTADAVAKLRKTIRAAELTAMAHVANVARRLCGQLVGGEEGAELLNTAEQWMNEQRVVDVDKVTRLYAPGFPR